MRRLINVILTTIFFLFVIAPASAEVERQEWLPIRVIVYEDILEADANNCARQHLAEHLYAKLVHEALNTLTDSPFIVGAVSSIDKIVISVDVFSDRRSQKAIAQLISEQLENGHRVTHLASEAILYSYEEKILKDTPARAHEIFNNLKAHYNFPFYETCSLAHYLNNKDYYSNRKPRNYVIYSFVDEEPIILLDKNRSSVGNMPSIFYNLNRNATAKNASVSRDMNGKKSLLVLIDGLPNAINHIETVARIYKSAIVTDVSSFRVSVFGRGGFLVDASEVDITQLYGELQKQKHFFKNASSIERAVIGVKARSFVCSLPVKKERFPIESINSIIRHPYFELSTHDDICQSDISKRVQFEKLKLNTVNNVTPITVDQKSKNQAALSTNNEFIQRFSLCLQANANHKMNPNNILQIAGKALQQNLRMDYGLLLNIRFEKIVDGCFVFIAKLPSSNEEKLLETIETFDFSSQDFQQRLEAEYLQMRCPFKYIKKTESCVPNMVGFQQMQHSLALMSIGREKID